MRSAIALLLVVLLSAGPALAGISVVGSDGITATGADGVQFTGVSGITATGADGILTFGPNGITATGADGITATGADGITATGADEITATGADGITATGADGYTYTGANGITATGADSLLIQSADGITATGADGITATGADGTIYQADAIEIRFPNGITATGADGITATGADGITATGADSREIANANGITATGADGITISSADGITATGADGSVFSIPANSLTLVGADFMLAANAHGISFSEADTIRDTGVDALTSWLESGSSQTGLRSVDPELAITLNRLTDDSSVNAVIVYHHLPSDSDLAQLMSLGFIGGTRFRALPMAIVTGTRAQIMAVSKLPAVRSIYGNRTLNLTSEPEVRGATGVDRAWLDREITAENLSVPVSGRNVTVAVLDTGIDGNHPDLAGHVVKNIKLLDTLSLGVGFSYPLSTSLSNTDLLYGHGSFVAGVIGGGGNASNGKYKGVAPNAKLVGLSAGDLTLLYVLEGFDYLLTNGSSLNTRVVNCSFSANTVFDVNDPVNIATKLLADSGVNVVFSAGNTGPGQHTLNPYSIAPWVVSVGATDTQSRLATFSSRGDFASGLFRPTVVAPGVNVVSVRGSGVTNVIGAQGIANADLQRLSLFELPYYTTASGTSFAAPQVAGTIALMLEANPNLTPSQVRDILQRTATPLAPYYQHEVGAGMLNAHAAVLQAAFPDRQIGSWRSTLDRGQVSFANNPLTSFSGTVTPGGAVDATVQIPSDTVSTSIQIGWGPLWSVNDLSLSVYDSTGNLRAQSNAINLPGLTGKTERVVLTLPSAGTWRIRVRNTLGIGTAQAFSGVVQVNRVSYGGLCDANLMTPALLNEVNQNFRSLDMLPIGSKFRPDFIVSRRDLASSLVLGARVPQYLPGTPTYQDIHDSSTLLFVESVQASPTGALFTDVTAGGSFRPADNVTRLVAAVAIVRASGLRAEAEAKSNTPLTFLDASSIPTALRGYVYVAVTRGFIQADTYFRPQNSFTRGELAHAVSLIQNCAVQ
ncbi:MAG TPA: S8 family serine peptidase [Pyrinomonadaceae bacterium]|nr:S8 family serine peptidase [Pyrinomonadaceae bacterium]